MSDAPDVQNEFSRIVVFADVAADAAELDITASADEAKALAKRFDVKLVRDMTAHVRVSPHAQGYEVSGTASGHVEQTCAVTGTVLDNAVAADFAVLFMLEEPTGDLDLLEEAYQVDEITTAQGDGIDVGELAAQYFALSIDPFARAEGAQIDAAYAAAKGTPFDILHSLKTKPGENGS